MKRNSSMTKRVIAFGMAFMMFVGNSAFAFAAEEHVANAAYMDANMNRMGGPGPAPGNPGPGPANPGPGPANPGPGPVNPVPGNPGQNNPNPGNQNNVANATQTALDAVEDVKDLLDEMEEQADVAQDAIDAASEAVADAEAVVDAAEEKAGELADAKEAYNAAVTATENAEAAQKATTDKVANNAAEAAKQAQKDATDAKNSALDALEKAVNIAADNKAGAELTEAQKTAILEAAQEAQDAAEDAADAVSAANSAKKAAERNKKNAVKAYDKQAVLYGLPLYDTETKAPATSVTYLNQDGTLNVSALEKVGFSSYDVKNFEKQRAALLAKKNTVDTTYNELQNMSMDAAEQKLADAEDAYDDAEDAYDDAVADLSSTFNAAVRAASIAGQQGANALDTVANKGKNGAWELDANLVTEFPSDTVNGEDVFETAEEAIEEAKGELETIQNAASSMLNSPNLTVLLNAIANAEAAISNAEKALAEAKKEQKTANSYRDYALTYSYYAGADVTAPTGTAYAQIEKDKKGNVILRDANKENFDLTDNSVVSQKQSYFKQVSNLNSLVVPETVYRIYLEEVVNHIRNSNTGIEDKAGAGISTGGSLPIIYWALDDNDNILLDENGDPVYYYSTTDLETGKYLIAYSFKKESKMEKEGYHFDGYIYTFVRPEVEPEPEPEQKLEDDTEDVTPSNPGRTSRRTSQSIGEVLGAKRDLEALAEEGEVLGAVRAPKTGDQARTILWMLVMGASAVGVAAVLANKKKDEE